MKHASGISGGVIYGLDDRPPLPHATLLAVQHVLTMFGSTVVVPLLFGPLLWPVPAGLSSELSTRLAQLQLINTGILISSVMLCSGVATLLQSTVGSRLPIIQGVSFSFLAAFFGIVAAKQATSAPDWTAVIAGDASLSTLEPLIAQWQATGASAMCVIAGSIIVGGVIEAMIGFSGLMGMLRRYLSPVVVGPVIMLIGLALYQVGAPTAAANWPIAILTMAMIIFFSLVLAKRIRIFQLFPMLFAISIGVAVCGLMTFLGVFKPGDAAFVDLSAIESTAWMRGSDVLFPWGFPEFTLSAIVAVLAGYLASIIESFGDYHVCKNMAGGGDPTAKEISRGIGVEGVACAITGTLGGFSSTSYSENIGLVGLTKVGSRFVVQVGACLLIFLGLFGKFGACAAAIPKPVVGGLYCVLFGLIAAVGVRQFAKANLSSDRNLLIGGFALFMGLSLPFYFGQSGAADLSWMPEGIRGIVLALGSTGMAVGACIGLILDNVIPGTRQERGLDAKFVPELNDGH
jgi:solute carrier family 23 (nucleobase transporter), member 1